MYSKMSTDFFFRLWIDGLLLPANAFCLHMNMTRRLHNHRLQTDPWLHGEGTQNKDIHTTLKRSNQLSFSARELLNCKGHQEQSLETRTQTKLPQSVGATANKAFTVLTAFQHFLDIINDNVKSVIYFLV